MDAITRWSARTPEIREDPDTSVLPNNEEAWEAITNIQNLMERDAALEDRISEIQARIDRYNSLRRIYRKEVYCRRAVIAPIRFLPAEMLSHIFSFLVESSPHDVLRASHVCKDWKLATRFSQLWSHIVLDAETPGAEQLTRLFLRRSGEALLRVTFRQSEHVGGHWSAWDAVGYSAQRWTSLSITTADSKAAKRALRSIPAPPRLEELSVSIRGPCAVPLDERQFGFSRDEGGDLDGSLASSDFVRSLRLSVFTLPLVGPMFRQLTKLFIVDTFSTLENPSFNPMPMSGIVEVLASCTNLEDFSFDGEATALWLAQNNLGPFPISQERTSLPQLRTLHLRCHEKSAAQLLERIAAPNLESANLQTLSFRPATSNNTKFDNSMLNFLNVCPSLRKLSVSGFGGLSMLAALVLGLSHLESLHLDHPPDPDVLIKGISQKDHYLFFFEKPLWVARKLATLIIDAEPQVLIYTNIFHLLLARHEDQQDDDGPTPLVSFLVNGRDMGEEMKSQRFLEFVRAEATRNETQPPTRLQTFREFFV